MKKEDTMEYWVHQASKGRNVAECWQNCNRIMEETIKKREQDLIKKIEKLKITKNSLGYSGELTSEHKLKNKTLNKIIDILINFDEWRAFKNFRNILRDKK